jgi:hypothetical protein
MENKQMKKIEFYKAMLPVGTFEKCTGYQFCVGIHELVVHKTQSDGWTVTHKATGVRILTALEETTTRKAAISLIQDDPAMIEKIENGLRRPDMVAAENRMIEFLQGV